jgi:hypothetical protein
LHITNLRIDINKLVQPALDNGCGKNGYLVDYLRKNNITAFGIDRYSTQLPFINQSDWLEHDYGKNSWGTIVSHLGFSNHFKHHHSKEEGNYLEYGNTFMKILQSLKVEGNFHYTPGLPFIENYLDSKNFEATVYNFDESGINSIRIRRRS